MFLHTGLTELHMFFMTRSTFFSSNVFVISRLVSFYYRGNPLRKYFEEAKMQACNYAENEMLKMFF